MAVERKLMTADELWQLPRDGMRHELVAGALRTMSPTGYEHGEVEADVVFNLKMALRGRGVGRIVGGEVGFRLRRSPDTVRGADVAFVRSGRRPVGESARRYFEGAPDLAVEIVSPGDTAAEVEEKVRDWLRHGAGAVWVIYPSGPGLVAHRPDGSARHHGPEDEVEGGEAVPGFRMRLADLLSSPEA
jgi:Uma2 family endonuclease